jgi:hypothetical protein
MKKILLFLLIGFAFANAQTKQAECVIADGDSLSEVIDLEDSKFVGFELPTSYDEDTIYVQTSADTSSASFQRVYDDEDAALMFSVTAGRLYKAKPADYYLLYRYIRFESPSASSGADTLQVLTKYY